MFSNNIIYQVLYIKKLKSYAVVTKSDDAQFFRINGIQFFNSVEHIFKNISEAINDDYSDNIMHIPKNELNVFEKEIVCEFSSKEEFEYNAAEYLI